MPFNAAAPEMERLNAQTRVLPWPYYSQIHAGTTVSGAGPFTYAIPLNTEWNFFGYALNESVSASGDSSTIVATEYETNLQEAGKTLAGEAFEIEGIGLDISPDSNPVLVEELFSKASLSMSLNGGQNRFSLGRLSFYPAGGGLTGGGRNLLDAPSLDGVETPHFFATNGMPGRDNYFRLPTAILWRATGQDSLLRLTVRLNKAISLTSANVTAAAGIQGFTAPTGGAKGTYVKLGCRLYGKSRGRRSDVA